MLTHVYKDTELTWQLANGILLNTFAELEAKLIQHLESIGVGGRSGAGEPFWDVEPMIDISGGNEISDGPGTQRLWSVWSVWIGKLRIRRVCVDWVGVVAFSGAGDRAGTGSGGERAAFSLRSAPAALKFDVDVDSMAMAPECKSTCCRMATSGGLGLGVLSSTSESHR